MATGQPLAAIASHDLALWDRSFERLTPPRMLLEQIRGLLAMLGIMVEQLGTTKEHEVDTSRWFFWEKRENPLGRVSSEEEAEIRAAWGLDDAG